jgi:hypothetical protein
MTYVLWLDFDGPPPGLSRFVGAIDTQGLPSLGIVESLAVAGDRWVEDAAALVINSVVCLDQDEVRTAVLAALDRGRRLLVLRADVGVSGVGGGAQRHGDVNPWLESRYEIALLDDLHFDVARWQDPSWGNDERELLVARPADPMARLDPLLQDVPALLMARPRVVRVLGANARPSLGVARGDVVGRNDLLVQEAHLTHDDSVVAAVWAPPPSKTHQVVVLGDGGCLSDDLAGRSAANACFGRQLAQWLAGAESPLDVAASAEALVDEIDLTLSELVIGELTSRNAPEPWWKNLPEAKRDQLEQHGRVPLERLLTILNKVKLATHDPELASAVVYLGGRSKTAAMRFWGQISDIRNRVKHKERLLDQPATADELELLEQAADAVRECHRAWTARQDQDPRQLT